MLEIINYNSIIVFGNPRFFWDMIEADLYRSKDFDGVKKAGRTFQWGQKNPDIMGQIKATDMTPKILTPQDQLGRIDELMVQYTHQMKYKAYVYSFLMSASEQLAAKGQVKAALANFSQAVTKLPNVPDAYQKRARLYYQTGQYGKSFQDLKKAQSLGAQIDKKFEERVRLALAQS